MTSRKKFDREMERAMWEAALTVKQTGGSVEIGGVKIEACDEYGRTDSDRAREEAQRVAYHEMTAQAEEPPREVWLRGYQEGFHRGFHEAGNWA